MNGCRNFPVKSAIWLIAVSGVFFASAPKASAQIYQFYWKDNANNGNWDWGSSQWYSTQTNGNVGSPNYNGGEQLYFENTGNTTTTINSGGGTGGAPSGWIGLNAIFTQNASASKVYTVNSGTGINGIYLFNKIETLNIGTAAGLVINSAIQLGSATNEINAVAADIQLGALDLNGKILNSYGNKNLQITGVVSGSGTYKIQNQGISVTYSGAGANTFTGDTTVKNTSSLILNKSANTAAIAGFLTIDSGAVVRADAVNQLNNQLVTVNGTLNLNNNSQSTALAGSGAVTLGSATLTINNTASDTFGGVVSGSGSVVKTGVGKQIFNGNNDYTGTTTVNTGVLEINGNQTSATGNVTVNAKLTGTGTIGGATTISASGTLAPTAQASGSKMTIGSTVDFASGSIFEWDLNAATADPGINASNQGTYGQLAATGAATGTSVFTIVLGTNGYADAFWNTNKSWTNVFVASGLASLNTLFTTFSGTGLTATGSGATAIATAAGEGHFSFSGTTLQWTAVPEPTSTLAGLLLAAGLLRRRRD